MQQKLLSKILSAITWSCFCFASIQLISLFYYSINSPVIYFLSTSLITSFCIVLCSRICSVSRYKYFIVLYFSFVLLLVFFGFVYRYIILLPAQAITLNIYIIPGLVSIIPASILFLLIRKKTYAA